MIFSILVGLSISLTLPLNQLDVCKKCKHQYVVGRQLGSREFRDLVTVVSRHNSFRITRTDKDHLVKIVNKESSLKPTAKNKTSTAYGLFQFLNRTWVNVKENKTTCPRCQIRAGIKYINARYGGDYQRAWKHLQTKGYY